VLSPPSAAALGRERARQERAASTRRVAPSPEAASLFLTLAAGLRADLGDELEQRFSASGLAHVLSVSGLHVALVAVLLLRMLRAGVVLLWRGSRRFDARRVAAPGSIPLVWAYVIFTGNQMPAVRSAVMASAVLIGMAVWRRSDVLNGLSLAAIALIVLDPPCVSDLSTQLSFLAVASLGIVSPAIREMIPLPPPDPRIKGWRGWVAELGENALGTLCASVAVVMSSAPLIAETFHRLSLAGLISNIVCLPLCSLLTVLAAGGAAVHLASPWLSWPLLFGGTWASWLLLRAVDFFAALPGASVPVPSLGLACGTLFLLGLFGFALARGRARWIGLLVPASVALIVLPRALPHPGLTVTFLSVGHGDAIVMSSRGHHAIVDGGGVPGGADTGSRYVIPFLREKGISSFDLAVLSHPHPDHALGLITTLEAIPTARLWVPRGDVGGELGMKVIAAAGSAQVDEVEAGHPSLSLGEARIEVLGPPEDKVLLKGVNDRSVVLRVQHGDVTFLLTGDIEVAAEERLQPGPATVLKAPHHGSGTSSTQAFVDRVHPRHVVFCVGRRSRFHFPADEVVRRYREVGAQCHRTDLDGAVTFESDGHDVKVQSFLAPARPAALTRVARDGPSVQISRDEP
jgi:competence protein ComEC